MKMPEKQQSLFLSRCKYTIVLNQ